jgi:hypothetical protein
VISFRHVEQERYWARGHPPGGLSRLAKRSTRIKIERRDMHSHHYALHPRLLWTREITALQGKRSAAVLTNVAVPSMTTAPTASVSANPSSRNITHAAMAAFRRVIAQRQERPPRHDHPSRMSYLDGPRMSREMEHL